MSRSGDAGGRWRCLSALLIPKLFGLAVAILVVAAGLAGGFPSRSLAQTKRPPPTVAPEVCPDLRHADQQKLSEAERVAGYYREFAENTQKELLACLARIEPSRPSQPQVTEESQPSPAKVNSDNPTPTTKTTAGAPSPAGGAQPQPPPATNPAPAPAVTHTAKAEQTPNPTPRAAKVADRVRDACGLIMSDSTGAPG